MTKHRFEFALLLVAGSVAITGLTSVAGAVSSAEMYTAKSYYYGRFVARVQFAAGDGVVSSFFLWKDGSEKSGTFWNELDFEKLGADCYLETNAYYGNPAQVHSKKASQLDLDLCGGFHTYTYEWTPDYIAWSVDGTEIRREMGTAASAYSDNAQAGMQLRFNIWPGDATFGGKFSASILPVHEYVNWVEYYSYADGDFKLEWRDDFDAKTISSKWSLGSWDSPKGLSTHSPDNVNIVNGYAVLSLTADDALGAGDVAPEDSEGTGGTSASGGANSDSTSTSESGGEDSGDTGAGGTSSSSRAKTTASTANAPATSDSGGCTIQGRHDGQGTARSSFLAACVAVLLTGLRHAQRRNRGRRTGGGRP
ncbi:MAG TPA: family 16 glycosylhydrolase [Polyangiaceae bacterium]|nr:family 16 glycosylhydrolase [Polyangiaceae bacterium]